MLISAVLLLVRVLALFLGEVRGNQHVRQDARSLQITNPRGEQGRESARRASGGCSWA